MTDPKLKAAIETLENVLTILKNMEATAKAEKFKFYDPAVAYDKRHGGAFDRGAADSYYGRPAEPHYFPGATYASQPIYPAEGTSPYCEYMAGYEWNEDQGNHRESL